jgi:hypothetical protein
MLGALVPAGALAGAEGEISHLLGFIERSGCTFIRNGEEHTSQQAREHIENKYSYVKRRVKSAEDFIRYAATGSSISGRAYRVRCGGEEMPTAKWLEKELERFRREPASVREGEFPL